MHPTLKARPMRPLNNPRLGRWCINLGILLYIFGICAVILFGKANLPGFSLWEAQVNHIFSCDPAQKYEQGEPCLIENVRSNFVVPPSSLPYNFPENGSLSASIGNSSNREKWEFIKKYWITHNQSLNSAGYFVECGALDRPWTAPTLKLEREYNWTGLLVEANPLVFPQLLKMHRRAWSINTAVCPTNYSDVLVFYTGYNSSILKPLLKADLENGRDDVYQEIEVPCVPLYTILAALRVTTVDFFNLDTSGSELEILKTIPFDRVAFKIISVRHDLHGEKTALREFLQEQSFRYIKTINYGENEDGHSLFVQESIFKPEMLPPQHNGKRK